MKFLLSLFLILSVLFSALKITISLKISKGGTSSKTNLTMTTEMREKLETDLYSRILEGVDLNVMKLDNGKSEEIDDKEFESLFK
jgi:hypothetical protein